MAGKGNMAIRWNGMFAEGDAKPQVSRECFTCPAIVAMNAIIQLIERGGYKTFSIGEPNGTAGNDEHVGDKKSGSFERCFSWRCRRVSDADRQRCQWPGTRRLATSRDRPRCVCERVNRPV